eukprot:gb/GECG01003163.1/.p1 GENE.gb/GECG01003163.1/~~gb/GECG01003163.1/.p1  ORF type:complete len:121 (+),score=8.44 gb/GECG01003163.1/:1-363(+)
MNAAASASAKRISKELRDFQKEPIEGINVIAPHPKAPSNSEVPMVWKCTMKGAPHSIYEGEEFELRVEFEEGYPMNPPLVVFEGKPPVHPHIYQNGHVRVAIWCITWCFHPIFTFHYRSA